MMIKNTLMVGLCLLSSLLYAQSSYDIAIQYLEESGKYSAIDLSDIEISDEYQSRHSGITHLYLKQKYQGIEIKNSITNFNIKSAELLSANGVFVSNVETKINTTQVQISAVNALQKVMEVHELNGETPSMIEASNSADRLTIFEKGSIALEQIKVRLVYFEKEATLKLCWEVSLYEASADNWWNTFVDAQTSEIIAEYNQVIHCSFHKEGHNHSTKAAVKHLAEITLLKNATLVANSYNVFAFPVESPSHGSRTIAVSPWDDAGDAGTLGWHDDGSSTYTHTKGNNADAYQDHNNSNGPTGGDDARADGGASLEFDFPLDLNTDPELDTDPYITNLFYWNNLMHDVWYQYGFDEVSGNFQEDNQGRGGAGGDYVYAEAQDGGGTNNANFSTPNDGGNPRMQMYLWGAASALEINAPMNVAGLYEMEPAAFGGSLNTATTGDVVEVDDGSGNPTWACNALVNGGEISGNIALLDRGDCEFGTKCLNAQNAGAIGVIVCNNVPGLVTMGPGDDGGSVTIPAVMIRQEDCTTLRAELANGLNATVLDDSPAIDGDLDNGIIAHEYGHGISIRLTGGPSSSSCLNNAEQMGEGWSDFFGLWMTIEPGDNHDDSRGVGTYALGESTSGNGIRPAPYTTDMTVNDYTYGNVDDAGISQPHGIGFIWCTMIWDLNWAMINEHGLDFDLYNGTGGNNITAQLILDGLKEQPCSPGFVDGRDAILQADLDNNGEANRSIIWNVFARRGLGFSANQGSSGSRSDQTEAFDLPPDVPLMTDEELFENSPLPVELTMFKAVPNHEDLEIELNWTTAFELNNKGFDIQRQNQGGLSFETIAWIDGRSEGEQAVNYSFIDENVRPEVEYYYRLRQVDHDGREIFSEIVNAELKANLEDIQIFPNPSQGLSIVKLSDHLRGYVDLQILNTQGQIIGTRQFETNGGAEIAIDLSRQPEGVYYLEFEIGGQKFIKRIVLKK